VEHNSHAILTAAASVHQSHNSDHLLSLVVFYMLTPLFGIASLIISHLPTLLHCLQIQSKNSPVVLWCKHLRPLAISIHAHMIRNKSCWLLRLEIILYYVMLHMWRQWYQLLGSVYLYTYTPFWTDPAGSLYNSTSLRLMFSIYDYLSFKFSVIFQFCDYESVTLDISNNASSCFNCSFTKITNAN